MFQKATKRQAKLRLTFDGPAGSGKTFSSLVLAKGLGGKTALIDTEHGSASKYADRFDFDAAELSEFSLDTYIKAIGEAAKAGYEVLIIDSLSHAWTGKGGALEEVDRSGGANKFASGWKTVTPKHNRLVDTILAYPGHVICTMRTKMQYEVVEDKNGKKVPQKIGMGPIQREGMEYEFDVIAELTVDGALTITKTRCPDLSGSAGLLRYEDVPKLAAKLNAWLADGVEAPPATMPPIMDTPAMQIQAPPAAQPVKAANSNGTLPLGAAIAEAQSRADLLKLMKQVMALPDGGDKAAMRELYNQRSSELSNAAANS